MDEISKEDLERAAKRIMEMNAKAARTVASHKMPPIPNFVNLPHSHQEISEPEPEIKKNTETKPEYLKKSSKGTTSIFNLINFKKLLGDSDRTLLAGIMLLLGGEVADEKLMLALLYIML